MVEIEESPERKISIEALKHTYSLEDKFRRELDDMVYMQRMKSGNGHYMNTKKGIMHARVIESIRAYLHIGGHQ